MEYNTDFVLIVIILISISYYIVLYYEFENSFSIVCNLKFEFNNFMI